MIISKEQKNILFNERWYLIMANKITKKDNFMAIVEVLRENGKEELAKVMEHEIELLSAKAGKKSEKVIAEQASVDNMVLNALTT